MGTEIELYSKMVARDPYESVTRLSQLMVRSGLGGFSKEEQAGIAAIECLTKGISPNDFFRRYDIVQGRIRAKANSVYADFLRAGGKVSWINTGEDGKGVAEADFTHNGQTVRYRFTMQMADAQELVKKDSGWKKVPGNMLRARCLSNGIAMICPGVIVDTAEDDAEPAPAITASAAPLFATTVTASPPAEAKPKKETPPVTEAEIVPGPKADPPGPQEGAATAPVSATAPAIPHKVSVAEDGLLSPVTVSLFISLCAERGDAFEGAVGKWLRARGWVKEDAVFPEAIREIRMDRMQNVLNAFGEWAKVVEAAYKAGGAK